MCTSSTSNSGQHNRLPTPVEILLQFPYPRELVIDTYRKLLSTARPSRSGAASVAAAGQETDNDGRVTARMLLLAVEAELDPNFSAYLGGGAASRVNNTSSSASFAARWTGSGDESPRFDPSFSRGGDLPPRSPSPPRTATRDGDGGLDGDLEDDAPKWEDSPTPASSAGAAPSTTATTTKTTPTPTKPTPSCKITSLPQNTEGSTSSTSSTGTTQLSAAASSTGQTSPPTATAEAPPSVNTGASSVPVTIMPSVNTGASSVPVTIMPSTSADDSGEARRRQLKRLLALRKENQRLKNRRLCHKCRENPVDLTLLPCGHFCFCQACGNSFTSCPLCHKTILADVKTYVS